ncbi:hypothetical protein OG607_08120 [Streptomyces sp. NBC_01537]|uniref:hypothetical protein n=1 Tax=Streptomyces sp. NBC_01537 TaxID=2903896 RepID=UPI00386710D1
MEDRLQIHLSDDGSDPARLDLLTGYLRQELLQLDVEDVSAVPAGEAPPGARSLGVVEIGGLLVTLGSSVTALREVVSVLQSWWSRCRESRPSLRLTLDGDVLEISEASQGQVTDAFELFVHRHATAQQ